MKLLKCPNCNAPINRATMRCDYCGAVFKEEYDSIVMVENPRIITLCAEVIIDNRFALCDGSENYVVNRIPEKLAEGIANYMDVKVCDKWDTDQQIVRGRVRIVPPGTRL